MFDDVQPPQLVSLVHAEQPQHLEQQRSGREEGGAGSWAGAGRLTLSVKNMATPHTRFQPMMAAAPIPFHARLISASWLPV